MSYNSNEYKAQVYKKWLDNGRPWFDIDKSKEPTYAERQIIIEMKKRENSRAKRDIELEKSAAEISERYGKKGMILNSVLTRARKPFEVENY
jgi:indole-3-glycerol phosphate synthase